MRVEIWTDVMCPFCYIGITQFDNALRNFQDKDKIEIVYKGFQLRPELEYQPGKDAISIDSQAHGVPRAQIERAVEQIERMAGDWGIQIDYNSVKVANTFDAIRLIKLAGTKNKANQAEYRLFRAFFQEGKVVSDHGTLIELGLEIGLEREDLESVFKGDAFRGEVASDIAEAASIGVNGVPFFVINGQLAFSGAVGEQAFATKLQQSFSEWENTRGN